MLQPPIQITFTSPDETARFAERLGKHLHPSDVLLLEGGIGAGKTHFARHMIWSLQEHPEDVPSPTFTLVQTYEIPSGELWHADLYRLSHPDEVIELGLFDAFETAICLVEWPDRLSDLAPKNALTIKFDLTADPEHRIVTLQWSAPAWASRLKDLVHAFS